MKFLSNKHRFLTINVCLKSSLLSAQQIRSFETMEENKSRKIKRIRTPNFTAAEKKILEELVLKYHSVIEKKGQDHETKDQRRFAWMYLTEEYNIRTKGSMRSVNSLKVCWENMKRQIKLSDLKPEEDMVSEVGASPPPLQPRPERLTRLVIDPQCHDKIDSGDIKSKIRKSILQEAKVNVEHDPLECDDEDLIILTEDVTTPGKNKDIVSANITPSAVKRSRSFVQKSDSSKDSGVSDVPVRPKVMKMDKLKGNLAEKLVMAKIGLIETMNYNARLNVKQTETESELKIAILEEQLKQEKLKTEKLKLIV